MKKRPRRLLSKDGRHVLNIWFIPHHTEVLVMFKHLDDEACSRAMNFSLSIVASLHDMLQYLSAHARLGSSHARMGSQTMEFVSADWGGTEGIGEWRGEQREGRGGKERESRGRERGRGKRKRVEREETGGRKRNRERRDSKRETDRDFGGRERQFMSLRTARRFSEPCNIAAQERQRESSPSCWDRNISIC